MKQRKETQVLSNGICLFINLGHSAALPGPQLKTRGQKGKDWLWFPGGAPRPKWALFRRMMPEVRVPPGCPPAVSSHPLRAGVSQDAFFPGGLPPSICSAACRHLADPALMLELSFRLVFVFVYKSHLSQSLSLPCLPFAVPSHNSLKLSTAGLSQPLEMTI